MRRGEVFAVVVAEVIVADDGGWFDSGRHEKVHQDGLEFGLAGFEVVACDVDPVFLCQFNDARNEGVLWTAIDVANLQ